MKYIFIELKYYNISKLIIKEENRMTKPIVIVSIVILLGLGYIAWQSDQVSDVNNTETEPQAEVTNIVNDSLNNLDVKIDENKNKSEV